jgi:hypothetical protein
VTTATARHGLATVIGRLSSPQATRLLWPAFVITRIVLVVLAFSDAYGLGAPDPLGDVDLYHRYATGIVDEHLVPYRDLTIEYPPGAVLLFLLPRLVGTSLGSYRVAFVVLMLILDVLGLVGLRRLARRTGTALASVGPWTWVGGMALFGPVALGRFDIAAAVTIIWAFERAQAGRWGGAGAWLGMGAAIKLFPALLLPFYLIVAPKRGRLVLGAAIGGLVFLMPVIPWLSELVSNTVAYQLGRGVHHESLWGTILLAAGQFGYDVRLEPVAGSRDVISTGVGLAANLATVSLVAMIAELHLRSSRLVRNDVEHLAVACAAILFLFVGLSPVYSLQFVIWLLAIGAVVVTLVPALQVRLLTGLAIMTFGAHMVFPMLFASFLDLQPVPILMALTRNVTTVVVGILLVLSLPRQGQPEPVRLASS